MRYDTAQIKQLVTVPDLLARFGMEVNRAGFCPCPFHAEKTGSMKVWTDHVYCFGCHRKADVVDLAQELYAVPFKDAVNALCAEFGLIGVNTQDESEAHRRAAERTRERERKRAEQERLNAEYFRLLQLYDDMQAAIEQFAPSAPEDEQNPLFVYALCNIWRVQYELECAEAACIAFDGRKREPA